MPSYDSTLQEIKDRLDIVDVVSDYVQLKKSGQNWKGHCPFHTEKTPSFMVSPAKQIFHCFGCNSGGDIFTFILKYENITFPETLKILAKKAGVELKASPQASRTAGEKDSLLTINRDAMHFFSQCLSKNTEAQSYLNNRGITQDTQKQFSLGYAMKSWNALMNYLRQKGHHPALMQKAGLVTQGQKGTYDTFRDRIMFPIFDLKGDVIAFGGRSTDGSEPKYINSPETPVFHKSRVLYGLNFARESTSKSGFLMFMEGYLDVISAHQHGFPNAVAPLGTAVTPDHGKLAKRFTEDAVLVFDSDTAGINAAKKTAGILLECSINVKILTMPENDDPDSFLRQKGEAAFQQLLAHPLDIVEFFMRQKGDRRKLARETLETIAKVPDKVLLGEYVRTLAEEMHINESFVREELKKIRNRPEKPRDQQQESWRREPVQRPVNEVFMIRLMLQMPERALEVSGQLSEEDFTDPVITAVFSKIKSGIRKLDELLEGLQSEAREFLTAISFEDGVPASEKALDDCIKRIIENRLKLMEQQMQIKLKTAEKNGDTELLKQLQAEYHALLKQRR
ncbi:MAG: DNA primase [Nitrospira sp.]|nr:DNA primase [bacterium]MBL7048207.1 DNA primase [Nitrospira sp.]